MTDRAFSTIATSCGTALLRRPERSGLVAVILSEFRRARAAERRYGELRRNGAGASTPHGRADAPRQVFEEFYK
jgi:hypothetical protein